MSTYSDKLTNYWQDGVNVVLGLWLIASPWVLGYAGHGSASWNAYIAGVIIAVAAASAFVAFHKWEEWVNAALGAWLVVSPWLLGFADMQVALWNHLVVGAAVIGLALWSAFSDHAGESAHARN